MFWTFQKFNFTYVLFYIDPYVGYYLYLSDQPGMKSLEYQSRTDSISSMFNMYTIYDI